MTTSTSTRAFEIFASYSHCDARFVQPMMKLLLPTGATVFRDADAIQPGKKWAAVIADAIEQCRVLYLFWCNHSAGSSEVRKEYEQAISLNKDVVPVLLDDTPLPTGLKAYQWVDLREVIGRHEDEVEQSMTLDEGRERQRLDREAHGYSRHEDGYFAGEFWRKGWNERDGQYVRQLRLERDIPEAALRRAAAVLGAHLQDRLQRT
jgi:hypothetical protein